MFFPISGALARSGSIFVRDNLFVIPSEVEES